MQGILLARGHFIRYAFWGFTLLLVLTGALLAEGTGGPLDRTLSNNVRVLIAAKKKIPVASAQLWIRAGRTEDPPGMQGSAELLARLFGGPVIRRRLRESVPGLDTLGVTASSHCFDDSISVVLKGPASYAPEMVQALARLVTKPHFSRNELKAARELEKSELTDVKASAKNVLIQQLVHLAYTMHPYRRHPLDALDTLDGLTQPQLLIEAKRRLQPKNLVISVAGGMDMNEVMFAARQAFEEITVGADSSRPFIIEPKMVTPRTFIDRGTFKRERVALGYMLPPARSVELYPLLLFAELLGPSSRSEIRRELLAQLPGSRLDVEVWLRREPGLFIVIAEGKALDPGEVRARLSAVLSRAGAGGVRLSELARAKSRLQTMLRQRFMSPVGHAREMGQWAIYDHKVSLDNAIELIESVTLSSLERIVRDYLSESASSMAAQSRLTLPKREAMTAGSLLSAYHRTNSPSGVRLLFSSTDTSGLAACQVVLPLQALTTGPLSRHALDRLRRLLKIELVEGRKRRLRHGAPPELTSLQILPSGPAEPPDCVRIGFLCNAMTFLDTLDQTLRALALASRKSFLRGALAPSHLIVSIVGSVDPDLCRKTVDSVFTTKEQAPRPMQAKTNYSSIDPRLAEGFLALVASGPARGSSLEGAAHCYAHLLAIRLKKRLQEQRGLLRKVEVHYHPMQGQGRIFVVLNAADGERSRVQTAFKKEVLRLAGKLTTKEEVAIAKSSCSIEQLSSALDPCERALATALDEFRVAGPIGAQKLFEAIQKVTPAEIRKVAGDVLTTSAFGTR